MVLERGKPTGIFVKIKLPDNVLAILFLSFNGRLSNENSFRIPLRRWKGLYPLSHELNDFRRVLNLQGFILLPCSASFKLRFPNLLDLRPVMDSLRSVEPSDVLVPWSLTDDRFSPEGDPTLFLLIGNFWDGSKEDFFTWLNWPCVGISPTLFSLQFLSFLDFFVDFFMFLKEWEKTTGSKLGSCPRLLWFIVFNTLSGKGILGNAWGEELISSGRSRFRGSFPRLLRGLLFLFCEQLVRSGNFRCDNGNGKKGFLQ